MERVEAFRNEHRNGANLENFATTVQKAVENLRDKGIDLASIKESGVLSSDARTAKTMLSERTIRYYRTKGWIAEPYREKGRGQRYHEIHFLQMLAAYKLRLTQPTVEAAIGNVPKMTFDECLDTITGHGREVARDRAMEAEEPCDSFRVVLVTERHNPEALRIAKRVRSLVGKTGGSRLQFRIHEAEIDLRDAATSEIADEEGCPHPTNSEDGDGSIRSRIPKFRTQHGINGNDFVQVVTTHTHCLDWFADWGATNPRDGVIHLGDYEREFGVPNEVVAASYSLLLAFSGELAGRGASPYGLFHLDHSRGCLFDFCEEKRDIVLKLLSADICHDCLQRLRPLFGKGLMREVAWFLDTIRNRVRALSQYVAESEEKLREILRHVFVHALIESRANGKPETGSLPQDGDDLRGWVFESGVGGALGIARELETLRELVGELAANPEFDEVAWSRSRNSFIEALSRLHPDLEFVRIDAVHLKSGKLIAEGVSFPDVREGREQAVPWQLSSDGDLSALGITDAGATYAKIAGPGASPRFVMIDTHLRVVDVEGRSRAVLRLPDGMQVDFANGIPRHGCTAFPLAD